jgi:hypothetical protein
MGWSAHILGVSSYLHISGKVIKNCHGAVEFSIALWSLFSHSVLKAENPSFSKMLATGPLQHTVIT